MQTDTPTPAATVADGEVSGRALAPVVRCADVLDLLQVSGPLRGWTSLPCASPLDRARFAAALTVDPTELSAVIGQKITIAHIVIDLRTKADGTVLTHCVLIAPDGKMWDGSGQCLVNSLRSILLAMELPPWSPALPLDVVGVPIVQADGARSKAPALAIDLASFELAYNAGQKARRK